MSSPPHYSDESFALLLPSFPPSSIESSPFFHQVLQILIILHHYPKLLEARRILCTLAECSTKALEIVKLDHEQILLGQNLTRLVTSTTDLPSSEVRLLINELHAGAHKTEGLANQLYTDWLTSMSSLQRTSSLVSMETMVESFGIQLKGIRDVHANWKSITVVLQLKYTNVLADQDELEKLRNLLLSAALIFSAEAQHRLQQTHEKGIAHFGQLGKHADDGLKRFDEKISQHVVDLVLEWKRNRRGD
ncbi:hypothetical protein JCM3765_002921 [Sporobolomyces pararoseus]